MTRSEKEAAVASLTEKISNANFFYIADSSTLTVAEVQELRGLCYEKGVSLQVAKNTLIKKAMDAAEADYEELYPLLKGPTSLMFSEVSNMPAKVIKEFRKRSEKPVLKGAYIESAIYIGDDQIGVLSDLKSKEELVGEIIGLLQSPAKNVIGALQSGGGTLAGILKTLSEREEN